MLPPQILFFIHIYYYIFDQQDQNNRGEIIAHIFGTPIGTIWGLPGVSRWSFWSFGAGNRKIGQKLHVFQGEFEQCFLLLVDQNMTYFHTFQFHKFLKNWKWSFWSFRLKLNLINSKFHFIHNTYRYKILYKNKFT